MLKIKIKATGQIIEVKDFSRIIIDEENEEVRELSFNGLPVTKTETVIEPDCYYDQALNEKNFRKKLKRIGLLSV